MEKPWIYLSNPFFVATQNSMSVSLEVSYFLDNALLNDSSNPIIAAMYAIFHPVHLALIDAAEDYDVKFNIQEGCTLGLNNNFKILSKIKIKLWDNEIQIVHHNNTPEYKTLLPNRRKPFQSGKQLDRIHAVNSLNTNLTGDVPLANTKTDVDSFYNTVNGSYNSQKAAINNTKKFSNKFEEARIDMCIMQYKILGKFINEYAATPEVIAQYFALYIIRAKAQVHFTGTIKPLVAEFIVKRKLKADAPIEIRNTGTTELKFYYSQTKTGLPPVDAFTIAAGAQIKITASELGDISFGNIIVYNTHSVEKGRYVLNLL